MRRRIWAVIVARQPCGAVSWIFQFTLVGRAADARGQRLHVDFKTVAVTAIELSQLIQPALDRAELEEVKVIGGDPAVGQDCAVQPVTDHDLDALHATLACGQLGVFDVGLRQPREGAVRSFTAPFRCW